MQTARDVLTPDALAMLQTIASTGSFAAAARALGMVPSALTYRVRQIEDALDVLLFDRSSRQARPPRPAPSCCARARACWTTSTPWPTASNAWPPAGSRSSRIAVDSIIAKATVMELCDSFFAQNPPTRIRLRDETLSGTLEALTSGQADLALGVSADLVQNTGHPQPSRWAMLRFVYAVAPHHPLASAPEPLSDDADAAAPRRGGGRLRQRGPGRDLWPARRAGRVYRGQHAGQAGCPVARPGLRLSARAAWPRPTLTPAAWWSRKPSAAQRVVRVQLRLARPPAAPPGRALQWWLSQLESPDHPRRPAGAAPGSSVQVGRQAATDRLNVPA